MQKIAHRHIKLAVMLAILAVAVIGMTYWLKTSMNKQPADQGDTGAKPAISVEESENEDIILIPALNLQYAKATETADVSIADPAGGDFPVVTLVSEKLKKASYSCKGANNGAFGILRLVDEASFGPRPNFTKEIDGRAYGFISSLTKNCYEDNVMKEFREIVPSGIVKALEKTKEGSGGQK